MILPFNLLLTYIYPFYILAKLYWSMNLKFLVCDSDTRWLLKSFWCFKSCFKLLIIHFAYDLKTELQGCDTCIMWTRILIGQCTSITDMAFQEKIWRTIGLGTLNSLWIIGKVNYSVFYPFKVNSFIVFIIEHSIFPLDSRLSTQWTWTLICFKLISVVCILDKKLHMLTYMNLNDYRRVILNVKLKILKILNSIP